MDKREQIELLRNKVAALGQAEVARQIGYSASALSQLLGGTYKGEPENILNKVEEVFGSTTIACPLLGEIPLAKCAEHRNRPFAATNPQRVKQYRACRECGGRS